MGVADEFSRHVTDGHNVVFVHLLTVAVIDSQRAAAARVSEPCWRPDRERCAAQVTLPHTVFILRPELSRRKIIHLSCFVTRPVTITVYRIHCDLPQFQTSTFLTVLINAEMIADTDRSGIW